MASENRVTVNITPKFRDFVYNHARKHGFKSMAEALLSLAEIGAKEAGFEGQVMQARGKYKRDTE